MLSDESTVDTPVAVYKSLLRDMVNKRPSGTRQKIAQAIGKHKSFVSQITNPNYAMPVPAKHLGTILDLCHCSSEERRNLLDAYTRAHPSRALPSHPHAVDETVTISVSVPLLSNRQRQNDLAAIVRRFAADVGALARKWDNTLLHTSSAENDKGGDPR